jgi:hypothetical protein
MYIIREDIHEFNKAEFHPAFAKPDGKPNIWLFIHLRKACPGNQTKDG